MNSPAMSSILQFLVAKPKIGDYADCRGYDEAFLGVGRKLKVNLPTLTAATKKKVAVVTDVRRPGVLDYTNFSVLLNKTRRMCFYAVVCIDGNSLRRVPRSDTWLIDPRALQEDQTTGDVYTDNDLDRGHMVRRLDPVWGSEEQAIRANRESSHFTNACPQVHRFNSGIWGKLEDYLLNNAGADKSRLIVFTGPVFGKKDRPYRGIQLPERFWKVAVLVKDGGLTAAGFMLSQATDLENVTAFNLGEGRSEQVAIVEIEKLTGLRWPKLQPADTFGLQHGSGARRLLTQLTDIRLD